MEGLREDVKWTGLALRAQMEAASTPRTARPKRSEWPALALSEVNVKELAGKWSWECTSKAAEEESMQTDAIIVRYSQTEIFHLLKMLAFMFLISSFVSISSFI